MAITRNELLDLHVNLCTTAREVMRAKNQDYASEQDVFRNFRYFGSLGILVRLSDKLSRLRSFEENGSLMVADEKLEDTLIDAINYCVLYLAWQREQKGREVVEITDGPYCDNCGQLAAYRGAYKTNWCATCTDRLQMDTSSMDKLERL